MGFRGVSSLLASSCAFKDQPLRKTGINMAAWGGVVGDASETICQSVQTTSPRGRGVGGGERAATFNSCVCVGDLKHIRKYVCRCEKKCAKAVCACVCLLMG